MVPFAGWEMPVYYGGVTREVEAVRHRAGLFDVSHMGRLEIHGHGAEEALQRLTVNNVAALGPNAGQYSMMLRKDGGVLDDLIVYRREHGGFLLIVNASNHGKIVAWIRKHAWTDVTLEDRTAATALIALQGPDALEIARTMGAASLPARFHLMESDLAGVHTVISRTGYTGEDGLELIVPASDAIDVWSRLVEHGAVPCGLGARDTLRLEAAYCLYGHELSEETTPLEAGLSWVVKWRKGEFIGRGALAAKKEALLEVQLAGLVMDERSVPRQGQDVLMGDSQAGRITSGTFSPILGKSIALAFIQTGHNHPGARVKVISGDRARTGHICELPFYRSPRLAT